MSMGGGVSTDIPTGQMNNILQQSLGSALQYSTKYTNKAIAAQKSANAQSRADLKSSFQQSQALQAPYRNAGYNALDTYLDSLMQQRPEIGSAKTALYLNNAAEAQSQVQQLQQDRLDAISMYDKNSTNVDPYATPVAPGDPMTWDSDIQNLAAFSRGQAQIPKNKMSKMPGNETSDPYHMIGSVGTQISQMNGPRGKIPGNQAYEMQMMMAGYSPYQTGTSIREQAMQPAMDLYRQNQVDYNNLGQFLQNTYTPDQQKFAMAYNQGLFSAPKTLYY